MPQAEWDPLWDDDAMHWWPEGNEPANNWEFADDIDNLLARIDNARDMTRQLTHEQLVDAIEALLVKYQRVWRGPTQRELAKQAHKPWQATQ